MHARPSAIDNQIDQQIKFQIKNRLMDVRNPPRDMTHAFCRTEGSKSDATIANLDKHFLAEYGIRPEQ